MKRSPRSAPLPRQAARRRRSGNPPDRGHRVWRRMYGGNGAASWASRFSAMASRVQPKSSSNVPSGFLLVTSAASRERSPRGHPAAGGGRAGEGPPAAGRQLFDKRRLDGHAAPPPEQPRGHDLGVVQDQQITFRSKPGSSRTLRSSSRRSTAVVRSRAGAPDVARLLRPAEQNRTSRSSSGAEPT